MTFSCLPKIREIPVYLSLYLPTKPAALKLIETDEFIKAARLGRFGGASAARILMMVLRINKINKLYDEISHHRGMDFIDALIAKLGLEFEVSEEELKLHGSFLAVG